MNPVHTGRRFEFLPQAGLKTVSLFFFFFFFWVTGELPILRQQEAAADARRT